MVYATPLVCFVPSLLRGEEAFAPAASSAAARPFNRLERPTAFLSSAHRPNSHRLQAVDIATDANTEADLELLPKIQESILEENGGDAAVLEAWKEAVSLVASTSGLAEDLAEVALAKAYGWRAWVKVTSKFAKKYMKISVPDVDKLKAALDWPTSGPLGFSRDQLAQAIHLSPEVYLIDPAVNFEKALGVAPAPYNNADEFIKLANGDSTVLTCTTNCVDSGCASNCGNCWVSYDIKVGL